MTGRGARLLPGPLVTTDWLAANLHHPDLRILDCSALPGSVTDDGQQLYDGGRTHWKASHIPNSAFADLRVDLADVDSRWAFALPPAERFADAMEALGVGQRTSVVLYDADLSVQAARLWWQLRRFGFDDVAILDGGWAAWAAEGRPTSVDPAPERGEARFLVRERPEVEAQLEEVVAALDDASTVLVDAVPSADYLGRRDVPWYNGGRPGHIAGAVNLSGRDAVGDDGRFRLDELRREVDDLAIPDGARVITYCGVGVAAAGTAFVLHIMGVEDVAVYDASLQEWSEDPGRPMSVEPEVR